jgi:hypothetical protein
MSEDSRDPAGRNPAPALRHSYCSWCHPDPSDVVTLCRSRAHGADPASAPGVTDPDCIVCIDLLTQAHDCIRVI